MSILNWYLLKNYLKVLYLSVFSFIAILLVSRLTEIARFAATGAKLSYLALFIFYQIPYILPIALPISCLISSFLLFQRLSHTHELTALRSSGLSLQRIVAPILCAALCFACMTFYISSELATSAHLATRKMVYDLSSTNPLLLLQNAKIAHLQDAFIQMDPVRNGKSANNLIIALNRGTGNRLNLCLIKKIEIQKELFTAKQVSLISSIEAEKFDHLVIENQDSMTSSAKEFAQLLRKKGWKIANDHLKLSLLRIRTKMFKNQFTQGISVKPHLNKCRSELIRRISLGFSAFTFTLLGIAFGIEISRTRKIQGIFVLLLLTSLSLIAFCMGKAFSSRIELSAMLFILPHIGILIMSILTLRQINKGIE